MLGRISDEDGMNAGWRNIGRAALAAIPWLLGVGAVTWLGFFMAAHGWFLQLGQEQRRAVYVGAEARPKAALKIETVESCLRITRVDLEGDTASVYFVNECGTTVNYIQASWQLIAPDGTLLGNFWNFADSLGGPGSLKRGERGELTFSGSYNGIKLDDRASAIRFRVGGN